MPMIMVMPMRAVMLRSTPVIHKAVKTAMVDNMEHPMMSTEEVHIGLTFEEGKTTGGIPAPSNVAMAMR